MSSVINTNVKSMFASAALATNERQMSVAMNQLSTGKRIYSATVDAAGIALADKLTSQIRGTQMAVQNINDGISYLQTSEGALNEITNMAQRMYELSVQAANTTLSTEAAASITAELLDLATGIDDIITNTNWNGTTAGSTVDITISGDGTTATFVPSAAIASGDVTSTSTTTQIETFIAKVATQRGEAGSAINRLGYMADNLSNLATNLSASRSRTQDTDYATASAELARTQIISQAATAMLAQANQSSQSVLSLLK